MTLFYWSYWTKTILIRRHSLKNKFNEVKYWPKFHILNIWTLYKLRLQLNCNEIFYIHIQIFRFLKLQKGGHSLIAQLVKNPSAMQETPVWFLGPEDPLEKGKATHSSILAWRTPWTMLYSPWGHKQSDTTEQLSLSNCIKSI